MDSPLFTGGGANSVSIPPMAQTGFWRGHPPAKEGGAIGGGMNRPRLQPRCLEWRKTRPTQRAVSPDAAVGPRRLGVEKGLHPGNPPLRHRDIDGRGADYRAVIGRVRAKARAAKLESSLIQKDANSLRLAAAVDRSAICQKRL